MDNFIKIMEAGGIVSVPLLIASIAGLALIAERLFFWFRVNRRQGRMVREVLQLYRQDPDLAIKKAQMNADLPLARIFLEALELDDPNPEEFRLALESAAQAEIPLLKRFNVVFDTIINLSPLLGLLGTILGLMESFASLRLGDVGGSNATGVTGGITEALVSTVMGLVVAIFIQVFANTFRSFYMRQIALIQEVGGQLELLYRHRYERDRGEQKYAPTR
ncbi:MotA/TolQ/ExbB proton channel family protein [Laspinema olomoucense]|uniref:MotA/TolQ/ExbB proton channel family protein n=1 Tax=Laspinema olomoucense TaxID=3231600 RepID=UPI0021BA558D|nr:MULTISPECIES: MotA/TolQ/ExbB proton channel family protein [unclassified Laspinema]MCT7971805.1 MotA/TolQ/ExbB proton channel family protein [Laspinema sp. D3d]MCT7989117.1 MotA/TolQ/ExbB proton channel family protein [Laspinema sp. D3a]MCT7993409.1 MotA/TolQ/ExbB proton channel family protein [Laspinema sp. D3c]